MIRSSLKGRDMISLRMVAECPSPSPGQTKIAIEERLDRKARGVWRLAVLDLQTGQESLLAEAPSVDDQLAWPDDGRLLYALSRRLSETPSEGFVVPANGTRALDVFIPEASSPAVVW